MTTYWLLGELQEQWHHILGRTRRNHTVCSRSRTTLLKVTTLGLGTKLNIWRERGTMETEVWLKNEWVLFGFEQTEKLRTVQKINPSWHHNKLLLLFYEENVKVNHFKTKYILYITYSSFPFLCFWECLPAGVSWLCAVNTRSWFQKPGVRSWKTPYPTFWQLPANWACASLVERRLSHSNKKIWTSFPNGY